MFFVLIVFLSYFVVVVADTMFCSHLSLDGLYKELQNRLSKSYNFDYVSVYGMTTFTLS